MLFDADLSLVQFSRLTSAFVDSSSLIYMDKTGCLGEVVSAIMLKTIPEVTEETGFTPPGVSVFTHSFPEHDTDSLLLKAAAGETSPIISEDKSLILRADRARLPCFNTLMMLLFLLYKKRITGPQYRSFYDRLVPIARYGEYVLRFGEETAVKLGAGPDT
ncbi:MAG: hypothetical protein JW881_02985 [Spirochaetales bacterium]|nr:hypothetical protein [Spirochaetales bacterium]